MNSLPTITLKPGKEEGPRRFHPWVFSGAMARKDEGISEGTIVEVLSSKKEFLGIGHYADASIAVRLFCFKREEYHHNFWENKIRDAISYRHSIGLGKSPETNAYRLVFGEGDGLPGLIIDLYHRTAIMQCHSLGMWNARTEIAQALKAVLGKELVSVYDKSAETLGKRGQQTVNGYLIGGAGGEQIISENGNKFIIDWEGGQKTGFFLDQRDNRKLLASYSSGKSVLNTFCYTGGFSVYAMAGGAARVDSVDVSDKAMDLTRTNMELNNSSFKASAYHAMDTFDFFDHHRDEHDIIILDPPAFAKHHDARHQAVLGYKRLNTEALKRIRKGGILFTFSCSGVVDKKLFENTVMSAAINARREVRVMHRLSQPADHPTSIFHPEGEYLKGLVLFVR